MSCGVGCRLGSDPAWLWFWRRPVATAPIRPLAWKLPFAAGAAQRNSKKTKKKKKVSKTEHIIKDTNAPTTNVGLKTWFWKVKSVSPM